MTAVTAGKAGERHDAQAHDTSTPGAAVRPARRADAGVIQLTRRDIEGLLLGGEREQPRLAVREVPAIAFLPEPLR